MDVEGENSGRPTSINVERERRNGGREREEKRFKSIRSDGHSVQSETKGRVSTSDNQTLIKIRKENLENQKRVWSNVLAAHPATRTRSALHKGGTGMRAAAE